MAQTTGTNEYIIRDKPNRVFVLEYDDVVLLSQGEYSDYRVVGVLIRVPGAKPIDDLMIAFRTRWKMQPPAKRVNGWAFEGPHSVNGFLEMCREGGWKTPRVHEFYLENYGQPDGDWSEYSATTYGNGHPNTPTSRRGL